MPRLWFKPSQVAAHTRISGHCLTCRTVRPLNMGKLIEAGLDVPLIDIERRLRCRDTGPATGSGRVCGGRMEIGVWVPSVRGPSGMHEDLPVLAEAG